MASFMRGGVMSVPAVEIFTVEEFDRRISEAEQKLITGCSRTTRWRLAKKGKYPNEGRPWLSEVLLFAADPENYRVDGAEHKESIIPVRKVRRRAIRRQKTGSDV